MAIATIRKTIQISLFIRNKTISCQAGNLLRLSLYYSAAFLDRSVFLVFIGTLHFFIKQFYLCILKRLQHGDCNNPIRKTIQISLFIRNKTISCQADNLLRLSLCYSAVFLDRSLFHVFIGPLLHF